MRWLGGAFFAKINDWRITVEACLIVCAVLADWADFTGNYWSRGQAKRVMPVFAASESLAIEAFDNALKRGGVTDDQRDKL